MSVFIPDTNPSNVWWNLGLTWKFAPSVTVRKHGTPWSQQLFYFLTQNRDKIKWRNLTGCQSITALYRFECIHVQNRPVLTTAKLKYRYVIPSRNHDEFVRTTWCQFNKSHVKLVLGAREWIWHQWVIRVLLLTIAGFGFWHVNARFYYTTSVVRCRSGINMGNLPPPPS